MLKKVMRILILTLFLTLKSVYGAGVGQAIANGLGSLSSGISEINLESDALGIDKGIVAGTIIGLSRTVEKNPFPTSKEDQFLVKDYMKIGYQLGAGFVVSGIVSYVQEWTLVYPVATNMKGTLSRKFLVDLFLPLRIAGYEDSAIIDKLPQDYSLIREVSLQGHGRIKLGGGVPFLIGIEGRAGKVLFNRHLLKRRPQEGLSVMRETGDYWHLASELWMNLALFNLPIADNEMKMGDSTRVYLKLPERDYRNERTAQLARSLLSGEANDQLEELIRNEGVSRVIKTQFKESYAALNFIALFNRETFTREDYVTDTLYNEGGPPTESEWWVYQDRHIQEWTTGLQSETMKSQVFLEGEWQEDGLSNPLLSLHISAHDFETTQEEYDSVYYPLLRKFESGAQGIIPSQEARLPLEDLPYSQTQLIFRYDESDLLKLLALTERDWFEALEIVTGKKSSFWKQTAKTGFHGRERSRLRQNRMTLRDLQMAKKVMSILRLWKKAQKLKRNSRRKDQTAAFRIIGYAMRRSLMIGDHAWNTKLLEALEIMVPASQKILGFTLYPQDINRLSGTPLAVKEVHRLVKDKNVDHLSQEAVKNLLTFLRPRYNMLLDDPSEIYHHFRTFAP